MQGRRDVSLLSPPTPWPREKGHPSTDEIGISRSIHLTEVPGRESWDQTLWSIHDTTRFNISVTSPAPPIHRLPHRSSRKHQPTQVPDPFFNLATGTQPQSCTHPTLPRLLNPASINRAVPNIVFLRPALLYTYLLTRGLA
jgi:hypothetical protein